MDGCLVDDYVFLNDEPFSEEFKRYTSGIASGECKYGLVPKEHWEEPAWIDEEKASKARKEMEDKKVIYGGSKAYRRMCKSRLLSNPMSFNETDRSIAYGVQVGMKAVRPDPKSSRLLRIVEGFADAIQTAHRSGFFFRHPLLDQYDYYWVCYVFYIPLFSRADILASIAS